MFPSPTKLRNIGNWNFERNPRMEKKCCTVKIKSVRILNKTAFLHRPHISIRPLTVSYEEHWFVSKNAIGKNTI